jgi:hypothetical protein
MYRDDEDRRKSLYQLTTDALVVHCPSNLRVPGHPIREQWELAQQTLFTEEWAGAACGDHSDVTVITYTTSPDKSLLEACCDHLDVRDLVVLGRDEPWSYEVKILPLRDYLRSNQVADYVLCLDAYDVLLLGCPDAILDRYRQTNANVLFNGTEVNWPFSIECGEFEHRVGAPASPAHRHLNSGVYLGPTSSVLTYLDEIAEAISTSAEWCRDEHGFNDQLAWKEMHRRHYPDIRVDTMCSVFARFDEHR